MFSPNSMEIIAELARMHQEDLLREAGQERLLRQGGTRKTAIQTQAAWWLGGMLIAAGERLAAGQVRPGRLNRAAQNCA